MRFPILTTAIALCLALPSLAQDAKKGTPKEATTQKLKGMSFAGERATTTLAAFSEDFSVAHMATINHGQPEWHADYDKQMDMLKGKISRLGKDMWTTYMSNAAIELGGTKIPAGSYVIGLQCDKDGKFALAFLDSSKAMKDGLLPFGPQNWKPDFVAPVTLNKDASTTVVEKMTMTFKADEKEAGKGAFTLAWGKHTLTAPAMLQVSAK
ncbi:MAG: hypothetical protein ABIP94_19755 [Planctomycetota bacterium]